MSPRAELAAVAKGIMPCLLFFVDLTGCTDL